MNQPCPFTWTGEVMEPLKSFKRLCDQQYVVGQQYRLVVEEKRSTASHDHYFACIEDAFANLPESLKELYPTSEHLRKRALIAAGYADQQSMVCSSHAEAIKTCAFMRRAIDYSLVTVEGATVTVFTAKSQSRKAMGNREFQRSKELVLDILSEMCGITTDTLKRNAVSHA